MAGDWIKVEVALPDKPEVWQIAGILHLDADCVVGKLIRVWAWFDAHTENGNAHSVTYALLDRISGVTGFAEAMALVGWLSESGADVSLPKFDRHNGKTAKNRALTAKRVASNRVKSNAECNGVSVTSALPREEKRREEEKQKSPSPNGDLLAEIDPKVASDFQKLRRAKKAPLTQTALDGIRREAVKANITLESALSICCERGWTGFKAEWLLPRNGNVPPVINGNAEAPGGGRRML